MEELHRGRQHFRGVGPKRARHLERLGVFTVEYLLNYYSRAREAGRQIPQPRH